MSMSRPEFVRALAEREGRPALEATITVARERDNGTEVLGGILVRARVYAVDFVIATFDDLLLRRAHDGATGLALLSEAKRIAMPASAGDASARGNAVAPLSNDPAKPVISFEAPARGRVVSTDDEMADATSEPTWAEVVVASAAAVAQADAEPAEDEPMRPGDLLEHFKFGACAVERIEGDGEIVHLRMRNGRLVRLSLDVLEIVYAGVEAGGKNRRYRAVQPR